VLTVKPSAYEKTSPAQLASIPVEAVVERTSALDFARVFSVRGRYWTRLALPDRWSSWKLFGVPAGLQLVRRHHVRVIWSTYPIATAHSIGATLSRFTGLPWIADFRDPMVEYVKRLDKTYPLDPRLRAARLRIEALAVKHATKLVFCTDAAAQIVADRYPQLDRRRLAIISNGYDEDAFVEAASAVRSDTTENRTVLLHSGTIYLSEDRDPTALFRAIAELATRGVISTSNFELRLRSPSAEAELRRMIANTGCEGLVTIAPALPYTQALAEMMGVAGLLILQGHTSNPAVPAKLYEYMRAGRPIVGLVDAQGETAATLKSIGNDLMADIADSRAISALLEKWLDRVRESTVAEHPASNVKGFSRSNLTVLLAQLLNQIAP
jgi:glycosyltransferase involved in cell wall biosynthesis